MIRDNFHLKCEAFSFLPVQNDHHEHHHEHCDDNDHEHLDDDDREHCDDDDHEHCDDDDRLHQDDDCHLKCETLAFLSVDRNNKGNVSSRPVGELQS